MAKQRKRSTKDVPAKGRLRDMADRLWSLAVRDDWGNECAVCGAGKCDAHHIIPRQHQITRYDLQNGIALCSNHHQFDKDVSPHQNATGFVLWLEANHAKIAVWAFELQASGGHWVFDGNTSWPYYCDEILRLKEYVDDADYARIVGKRFSAWLEDEYPTYKGGTS